MGSILSKFDISQGVILTGPYGVGKLDQVFEYATEILGLQNQYHHHPDLMIVDILASKSIISLDQIKEAGNSIQT